MLIGNNNGQKLDLLLNEAKMVGLIDRIGHSLKEKVKEKKNNGSYPQR